MQQIARTAAQTKKIPFTKNKRTCPPLGNSTALKCCMVLHESSGTRQIFERDNASFIYIYIISYYIYIYVCMYHFMVLTCSQGFLHFLILLKEYFFKTVRSTVKGAEQTCLFGIYVASSVLRVIINMRSVKYSKIK